MFETKAKPEGDPERCLLQQTSARLKGLVWESREAQPRVIILDGVAGASLPAYRFLQRLYFAKDLGLALSARDLPSLGALTPPVLGSEEHASRLFDLAVIRFGFGHLDLGDFRDKALRAAKATRARSSKCAG